MTTANHREQQLRQGSQQPGLGRLIGLFAGLGTLATGAAGGVVGTAVVLTHGDGSTATASEIIGTFMAAGSAVGLAAGAFVGLLGWASTNNMTR